MPCQELAELVTAYLDGALASAECARCDEHLRTCAGCRAYLAQMELVVGALGELRRSDGEEHAAEKARLLDLFRTRGPRSRAPLERSVPLGITDAFAAPGDHIGYFWEDDQEFDATAGFLAAGLERDEVCVLLGHDAANARVLAGLERRGLPPDDMRRRDRFYTVRVSSQPTPCCERSMTGSEPPSMTAYRWSESSGTSGGSIPAGPPSERSSRSKRV
jgi:anti-sigma factor RsiW